VKINNNFTLEVCQTPDSFDLVEIKKTALPEKLAKLLIPGLGAGDNEHGCYLVWQIVLSQRSI
jgi:hypothetical protein